MSYKSQAANMARLAELLQGNLDYIHGERESGPNGAKRDFLRVGRSFMFALGKDLGLIKPEVSVNKSGIACSGEVYLSGLWDEHHGLYLWLEQDLLGRSCIGYRTIRPKAGQRKGFEHGGNHFISLAFFAQNSYGDLLSRLLELREGQYERYAA